MPTSKKPGVGHNRPPEDRPKTAEVYAAELGLNMRLGELAVHRALLLRAIRDESLHRGHRNILGVIVALMGEGVEAVPSIEILAEECGLAQGVVRNILADLVKKGYLVSVRKSPPTGGHFLAHYTAARTARQDLQREIDRFIAILRGHDTRQSQASIAQFDAAKARKKVNSNVTAGHDIGNLMSPPTMDLEFEEVRSEDRSNVMPGDDVSELRMYKERARTPAPAPASKTIIEELAEGMIAEAEFVAPAGTATPRPATSSGRYDFYHEEDRESEAKATTARSAKSRGKSIAVPLAPQPIVMLDTLDDDPIAADPAAVKRFAKMLGVGTDDPHRAEKLDLIRTEIEKCVSIWRDMPIDENGYRIRIDGDGKRTVIRFRRPQEWFKFAWQKGVKAALAEVDAKATRARAANRGNPTDKIAYLGNGNIYRSDVHRIADDFGLSDDDVLEAIRDASAGDLRFNFDRFCKSLSDVEAVLARRVMASREAKAKADAAAAEMRKIEASLDRQAWADVLGKTVEGDALVEAVLIEAVLIEHQFAIARDRYLAAPNGINTPPAFPFATAIERSRWVRARFPAISEALTTCGVAAADIGPLACAGPLAFADDGSLSFAGLSTAFWYAARVGAPAWSASTASVKRRINDHQDIGFSNIPDDLPAHEALALLGR